MMQAQVILEVKVTEKEAEMRISSKLA